MVESMANIMDADTWENETRRREPDASSPVHVQIVYEGMQSPAEILSVSSGGIFIKTGLLLELGARVILQFGTDEEVITETAAQVTRLEPKVGSDEEIGLGLRFTNMDAKTWIRLERLLFKTTTLPKIRTPSNRMHPASASQRFRILYHDTEKKIRAILAEMEELYQELEQRHRELLALLEGRDIDRH